MDSTSSLPDTVKDFITKLESSGLQLLWNIGENDKSKYVHLKWTKLDQVPGHENNAIHKHGQCNRPHRSPGQVKRNRTRMAKFKAKKQEQAAARRVNKSNNLKHQQSVSPINTSVTVNGNSADISETQVQDNPTESVSRLDSEEPQCHSDRTTRSKSQSSIKQDSNSPFTINDMSAGVKPKDSRSHGSSSSLYQRLRNPADARTIKFHKGTHFSPVWSADKETGNLVFTFCSKCHPNVFHKLQIIKQKTGLQIMDKKAESIIWTCKHCKQQDYCRDREMITYLKK